MNSLELAIRGEDPRTFKGKTNFAALTEDEKEAFVGKRVEAIKNSDLKESHKQAALLRSGTFGISTVAAFDRYVNRDNYWFR